MALPLAAGLLILVGSTPRVIGDGAEYVGASLNLIGLRGTSMTAGEAAALQERFARLGPPLAQWDVARETLRNRTRHREFGHFWFYSALAAPFVGLASALHVSPLWGFAAFNLLLYVAAWRLLSRHASWRVQLLLFAGPVVWWLDKPHTEVFTVACLTAAVVLLGAAPWWAAVAAAAASTQNPPIAVFAACAIALTLARGAEVWRRRTVLVALALAVALAALHPVYYLVRFGIASPLVGFSTRRAPLLSEIGVPLWDPVMGIVAGWPLFAVAVVAAAAIVMWRRGPARPTLETATIVVTLAACVFSFAQTLNPAHGGTPGMSRYALWLGPLFIPVLIDAERASGAVARMALAVLAIASAAVSLIAFHPSRPELADRPTAFAKWLWSTHPRVNAPLPAVFVDSFDRYGGRRLPIAEPHCRKILLIGRAETDGMWPAPCAPMPIPERCRERGALCYADAREHGYTFTPLPRVLWSGYTYDPSRVWPKRGERGVAQALVAAGWWRATRRDVASPDALVRGGTNVRIAALFQSAQGAVAALSGAQRNASIEVRSIPGARISFVDADGGAVVESREPTMQAGATTPVVVPDGADLAVVTLPPERSAVSLCCPALAQSRSWLSSRGAETHPRSGRRRRAAWTVSNDSLVGGLFR